MQIGTEVVARDLHKVNDSKEKMENNEITLEGDEKVLGKDATSDKLLNTNISYKQVDKVNDAESVEHKSGHHGNGRLEDDTINADHKEPGDLGSSAREIDVVNIQDTNSEVDPLIQSGQESITQETDMKKDDINKVVEPDKVDEKKTLQNDNVSSGPVFCKLDEQACISEKVSQEKLLKTNKKITDDTSQVQVPDVSNGASKHSDDFEKPSPKTVDTDKYIKAGKSTCNNNNNDNNNSKRKYCLGTERCIVSCKKLKLESVVSGINSKALHKIARRPKKSNSLNEDSSGETTDNLDDCDIVPKQPVRRRLSDVSTISSSGAGYLCDSESGDERVSDASLDIFKPVTVTHHSIQCKGESGLTAHLPAVSTHSETITTSTPTSTVSSTDVAAALSVTAATSLASLPGNLVTTTCITVTTSRSSLNTPNSASHPYHHSQQLHQSSVLYQQQKQQQQQYRPNHHSHHLSQQQQHLPATSQQTNIHHHQQQQQQQQQQHLYSSHQTTDNKYSSQFKKQQKVHSSNNNIYNNNNNTKDHASSPHIVNNSVIKRKPSSPPPLTRTLQPSSPKHRHYQQYPGLHHSASVPASLSSVNSYPSSSHSAIPSSLAAISTLSSSTSFPPASISSLSSLPPTVQQFPSQISKSVISRERDSRRPSPTPVRTTTPRREDSRESRERDTQQHTRLPASVTPSASKPFFPSSLPGHGTGSSLYSPLGGPSPSGSLPALHSISSHHNATPGPAFPGSGSSLAGVLPGPSPVAGIPGVPLSHSHSHPSLSSHSSLHPGLGLNPGPSAVPGLPGVPSAPSSALHQAAAAAGMFAAPLPLGIPQGPLPSALGGPPSTPLPAESLSSPDVLRDELNRRFLISQDRSPALGGMPPLIHQHMHQHQHQHMHQHQHTYQGGMPPPPPISTPSPFDKLPSNPFVRQSIPGLPGYPTLPERLQSGGMAGAFQPKSLGGPLHPGVGPLFIPPGRDLEKAAPHHSTGPNGPSSSLPSAPKKPGKWCAVHVRIAWEIYHHQQKPSGGDKPGGPSDSKPPLDPLQSLRPPSHLFGAGGGSLPRPLDLVTSHAPGRSIFDASPHVLSSGSHHASPFPRPPFSIGSSLSLGLGPGIPPLTRETGSLNTMPSLSSAATHLSSHPALASDWGRHRTPPGLPTGLAPGLPSPWPPQHQHGKHHHHDDRERERVASVGSVGGREDEHRERSVERRREEERERDRRAYEHDRHRFSSLEDRNRDRDRLRDAEIMSKSRSRSRSPMRNGRSDSVKSDRGYDRRPDEGMLKVKEERRESTSREEDHASERERMLKNEYFTANSLRTSEAFLQASMLDRARMMTPAAYLANDRVPPHPSFWNPFDMKGPLDFPNHRLSLQREMEQAREHFITRFPGPSGLPGAIPISPLEQERLREEIFLREKRDYLERLPLHERERLFYENSKIPGLRPPEHLHPTLGHGFPHTVSPALHNHIKRSSPSILPGAPPPLIHSGSSHSIRGHSSPAVNKTKGVSPTDSVGESKRDSNSNSTDPDVHSR